LGAGCSAQQAPSAMRLPANRSLTRRNHRPVLQPEFLSAVLNQRRVKRLLSIKRWTSGRMIGASPLLQIDIRKMRA
jgi:hypothetical protein